jgi:flagellar motility protein MotE (MotC chaperone)
MPADIPPGSAGWFWAAAAGIISVLSGVVSFLYRQEVKSRDKDIEDARQRELALAEQLTQAKADYRSQEATMKEAFSEQLKVLESKHEECLKDREELRVRMARFETRLEILEKYKLSESKHVNTIDKRLDKLEDT